MLSQFLNQMVGATEYYCREYLHIISTQSITEAPLWAVIVSVLLIYVLTRQFNFHGLYREVMDSLESLLASLRSYTVELPRFKTGVKQFEISVNPDNQE